MFNLCYLEILKLLRGQQANYYKNTNKISFAES